MPRSRIPPIHRRTPGEPDPARRKLLKTPVPVWRHLAILAEANYAEDAIILYEVTNQATSSNRPTIPDDLTTYRKICEFYDRTKRFAQAGAILKTLLQTIPDQRPFRYPSHVIPVGPGDEMEETDEDIEEQDCLWYCYYCVLEKTSKFREAHDALMEIRGKTYGEKRDEELPSLVHNIKNPRVAISIVPEQWKPEYPDETSSRQCSSSLHPVMKYLKRGGDPSDLANKISRQFIGKARTDVYWWLKSAEAVGQNKVYEAIACLGKMSHNNPRVLTEMAKLNYSIDKRDEARRLLKTAHANDPLWIEGMDLLVFMCIGDMEKHGVLIQEISQTLRTEWPHRVETFIVNGFMAHQFDLTQADAFANRAMQVVVSGTEQYIYAVHLKAYCLKSFMVKTNNENNRANYREKLFDLLRIGVRNMPTSADLALLYVDSLMEDEQGHRDAKIFATQFLHKNPNNVHGKLLKVHVLVNGMCRNPDANHPPKDTQELIGLLNGLIDDHPHILAAFCFLLNEHGRLKDQKKSEEVLEKLKASRRHFPQSKVSKMHRVAADFLLKFGNVIPAYEHLMAAMATGAVVDAAMMSNYEQEFQHTRAVQGDYTNLAFIDSLVQRH